MNRINIHTWPPSPTGKAAFLAQFRFFILFILFILSQILTRMVIAKAAHPDQ